MLCIAVCNSLTISKSREGRVLGFTPCTMDAQCVPPGGAAANSETCDTRSGICRCADLFQRNAAGTMCIVGPGAPCAATGMECVPGAALGLLCYPGGDTTMAAVTAMGAGQTCECAPPTGGMPGWVNVDGTCVGSVGTACTTNAMCALPNQICMGGFCSCMPGSTIDATGTICQTSVGGVCANDAGCPLANQMCVNGACACGPGSAGNAAGACVATVGGACPMNTECTLANQGCFVTSTGAAAVGVAAPGLPQACQCLATFGQDATGACVAGVGAACLAAPATPAGDAVCTLPNQLCYGPNVPANGMPNFADPMPNGGPMSTCACNPLVFQEAQGAVCVRSLGAACAANADCGLTNSVCTNGACACAAPFVDTNGATAGGACSAPVGADCPRNDECTLPNQDCIITATGVAAANLPAAPAVAGTQACQCIANFGVDANGQCQASVGAGCPMNNECTLPNQDCIVTATMVAAVNLPAAPAPVGTQTCQCVANFAQNAAGACVASLGAACTANADCTLPGQACSPTTNTCVVTVGGACAANADCTLDNQDCNNNFCRCLPGWAQNANGACTDWPAGFCGTLPGGCAVDQGDCNDVADCNVGLLCGVNNCGGARPLADCCVDPTNPTGEGPDTACDGTAPNVWGCCTPQNKCDVGEGDCDSDLDCGLNAAGVQLECVADSCTGAGFGSVFPLGQVDCCQEPAAVPFYSNFVDGMDKRIERWTNDEEPARPRPKY